MGLPAARSLGDDQLSPHYRSGRGKRMRRKQIIMPQARPSTAHSRFQPLLRLLLSDVLAWREPTLERHRADSKRIKSKQRAHAVEILEIAASTPTPTRPQDKETDRALRLRFRHRHRHDHKTKQSNFSADINANTETEMDTDKHRRRHEPLNMIAIRNGRHECIDLHADENERRILPKPESNGKQENPGN